MVVFTIEVSNTTKDDTSENGANLSIEYSLKKCAKKLFDYHYSFFHESLVQDTVVWWFLKN